MKLQEISDFRPVEGEIYAECLAEFARAGTQIPHIAHASSSLHSLDALQRLESSNEDSPGPGGVRRNIDTVVRAVNVIDVNVTICLKHDLGSTSSAVSVRRRVIRIGLNFNDTSDGVADRQEAPYESGSNFESRECEELAADTAHGGLILDNLWKT